jgi:hypothetical protein
MSAFEEAKLYMNRVVRNKDKNKLRRTARNRSYKNIKKEKEVFVYDENVKNTKRRKINMLKNKWRKERYSIEEKEQEKPKMDIDLNNVYDDIKADTKQNITIFANGKHNKTLKN